MRQLASLFGISPATVCRVVQRLRPLLALEPVSRPVDAADRLWIVDGTLVPVRDSKVGASSRNYRFSVNVQVIIDADPRLVVATARPAPGNTADAHVWRHSGLPQRCQSVTVLGDGAYINPGLVVPHCKRLGRSLFAVEEADNAGAQAKGGHRPVDWGASATTLADLAARFAVTAAQALTFFCRTSSTCGSWRGAGRGQFVVIPGDGAAGSWIPSGSKSSDWASPSTVWRHRGRGLRHDRAGSHFLSPPRPSCPPAGGTVRSCSITVHR